MNHLFCKTVTLQKSDEGKWQLVRIGTNRGKFEIGEEQNEKLQQDILINFASYAFASVKADIEGFLAEEEREKELQAVTPLADPTES